MHNGTFNLAFHPWKDPFERVSQAAAEHEVRLTTPIVGEVVSLATIAQTGVVAGFALTGGALGAST